MDIALLLGMSRSFLKHCLLVVVLSLFPLFPAFSEDLPEPEGLKVAAEVEFMAGQLAHFVHFFDVHFLYEKYGQNRGPDWATLPPDNQAQKVIEVTGKHSDAARHFDDLKLREDAPKEVKAAFARFIWSRDNHNILEFRYKEPVTSSNQFLAEVTAFATVTGILEEVFDPPLLRWEQNPSLRRFSMHYHLSVAGRDFSQGVAQRLNYLHFLERVRIGLEADFKNRRAHAPTVYRSNVTNKGVIRLFDKDRIETRRQVKFREDLRRILKLASVSEPMAMLELDAMIDAALAESDVLETIWKHDEEFLADGLDFSPRIFQFLKQKAEGNPKEPRLEKVLKAYVSRLFVSSLPDHTFANNPQPLTQLEKLQPRFKYFEWDILEKVYGSPLEQILGDMKRTYESYPALCEGALRP